MSDESDDRSQFGAPTTTTATSPYAIWLDRGIATFDELRRERAAVTLNEFAEALAARWGNGRASAEVDEDGARWGLFAIDPLYQWVWKTVLSIPGNETVKGRRSAVKAGAEREVVVFDEPAEFVVRLGLHTGDAPNDTGLFIGEGGRQVVLVRTRGPVRMKRGKSGHLECVPVPCELWIPVERVREIDVERASLGEMVKELRAFPHALCATVASFNHAYAVASRRLEPDRLSHGGSIYSHVAWTDRAEAITLKAIREAVQADRWRGPRRTRELRPKPLEGAERFAPDAPPWPCRRDGEVDLEGWAAWRTPDPQRGGSRFRDR